MFREQNLSHESLGPVEGLVEILWRNFKWERALKGTEYLVIVIIIIKIIIIIIIIWGGGGMAD